MKKYSIIHDQIIQELSIQIRWMNNYCRYLPKFVGWWWVQLQLPKWRCAYVRKQKWHYTTSTTWYRIELVGWTLRLRWATSDCGRPTKVNTQSKGDRSRPAKHPPMAKLVSRGKGVQLFGSKVLECSYPRLVQTGPLYRDPGDGYSPNNFHRICGSQWVQT